MPSHIDTTKAFFSAWARHDHAAVLALLHDDVAYQNMPFTDVLHGKLEKQLSAPVPTPAAAA